MPASFPNVLLPTPRTRTLRMPCEVVEFLDGSEQRFAAGDPLNDFALRFVDVPAADLVSVQNFWATVKGAFDVTWSYTDVDGTVYPHMGFDQDELTAVEQAKPGRYSFSLKLRQTAKDGVYTGVGGASYPTLPNGLYTQLPYSAGQLWRTTRNDLASGPRYAWAEWASAKGRWVCEYPVLTAAEMQGRIDFFMACWGRLVGFSFMDPNDGVAHAKCRFDQDGMEIRCVGAGQWATTLKIAEYF